MKTDNKYYGLIYKCTNIQNNKYYIGRTSKKFKSYIKKHIWRALSNKYDINKEFYKAIREYGERNFKWEILGYCNSLSELKEAENLCIQFFNSSNTLYGYNMLDKQGPSKPPSPKGRIWSKESKLKLSISQKGLQSGELHPMFGKHQTEEWKSKRLGDQKGKNNNCAIQVDTDKILELISLGKTYREVSIIMNCSIGVIQNRVKNPERFK